MEPGSITRLFTRRQCPLAYKLQRDKSVPQDVPYYVRDGAYAHRAIEWLLKEALSPSLTLDAMERELPARFPMLGSQLAGQLVGLYTEVDQPGPNEEALIEQRIYLDRSARPVEPVLAFWQLRPDYAIAGRQRLVVEDWKTGWGFGSAEERAQVVSYAGAILASHYNTEPADVIVRVRHPRRGHKDEAHITTTDAREALEQAMAEWEELEESGDEDARPGAHCAGCFVRASCPAYQKIGASFDFGGDPKAAWAALAAIQEQAARLKSFLTLTVETGGPITMDDGKVLDLAYSESKSFDLQKVLEAAERAGIERQTILAATSIGMTTLKKALRRRYAQAIPEIAEASLKRVTGRKSLKLVGGPEKDEEDGDEG